MSSSEKLIDFGGRIYRIPNREREVRLPMDKRATDTPISAVWHVVGRPSDLALVQVYAQRLGITISWEPSRSRRPAAEAEAAEARDKEKAIRESE
jgi:hypothetical protein